MYDANYFTPFFSFNILAIISFLFSLLSFIFILIEFSHFKRYGISSVEFIYSKLYVFSWLLGTYHPLSLNNRFFENKYFMFHPSLEYIVRRNHLNLFRSCEYYLFEKEKKLQALTWYDMNFTSIDYQTIFSCKNYILFTEYKLMTDVWRIKDRNSRVLHALDALNENFNCPTALLLLAEEQASSFSMLETLLRLALKAAENNYNKTKIIVNLLESKDCFTNSLSSSNDQLSSQSVDENEEFTLDFNLNDNKQNAFSNKKNFLNFTNNISIEVGKLVNKFDFHDIEKEVYEVIQKIGIKPDIIYEKNDEVYKCNINEFFQNEIEFLLRDLEYILENEYDLDQFIDELLNNYKVIAYIKRRLAMCLRKQGKLKEALKIFKELNKEFTTVSLFSCFDNLMDIYLEMEAYNDLQALLSKYDGIDMPKSAVYCYTVALMKMRSCAEKYLYIEEPSFSSCIFSNDCFNKPNENSLNDQYLVLDDNDILNLYLKNLNNKSNQTMISSRNQFAKNCSFSNNHHMNSSTQNTNQVFNCFHMNNANTFNSSNNCDYLNENLNSNLANNNNFVQPINSNVNLSLNIQVRNELTALIAIFEAVEFNPHVPIYLLEQKPLTVPPEHILKRGDTEAVAYAFVFLKHWKNVPGALKMLEMTWRNSFRMFPNPTVKGNIFFPYPKFIPIIDRKLLPDHFEVSVYPNKDVSLIYMFFICVFLSFGLFISLIYCYPDHLIKYATIVRTILVKS